MSVLMLGDSSSSVIRVTQRERRGFRVGSRENRRTFIELLPQRNPGTESHSSREKQGFI